MISTKDIIDFPEKQLLRLFNNILCADQPGGRCSALTGSHTEHTKDKVNCSVKYSEEKVLLFQLPANKSGKSTVMIL